MDLLFKTIAKNLCLTDFTRDFLQHDSVLVDFLVVSRNEILEKAQHLYDISRFVLQTDLGLFKLLKFIAHGGEVV